MNHPAYTEFISILMNEAAFRDGCEAADVLPTRRQARKFAQKRGAAYRAYLLDRANKNEAFRIRGESLEVK